ncbi:MAG: hypothetical protein FJ196_05585 [Gammaproteobacteria bacterium]|nr:hypothetical protein [Gammaproteobacteria bacterium]
MAKRKSTDSNKNKSTASDQAAGVFKSDETIVSRLQEGTRFAVSNTAVMRDPEGSSTAEETTDPAGTETDPAETQATRMLENLEEAIAKADTFIQSAEQRQSEIEDAHRQAKAMLEEINRIAEALTFSNALRDRINATVARTKRLRGNPTG